MPLADPRNIGREQAYGQSPSGPGPYAPPVRRQVPDLQPYTEAMGYVPPERYGSTLMNSPSGPRGAAFQSSEPSPAWLERIRSMLGNTTVGLDPARQQQPATYMERGGSPYRGQEHTSPSHPRYRGPAPGDNVIETTDPGRGYRGSPSNPNWQPRPKPMSPFFEPPRPPVGGP
jgi:hypothetical protein